MKSVIGAEALAEAWTALENDAAPHIADYLDIDFWLAVGDATGLDPALLSRGSLLHVVNGDPLVLEAIGF